MSHLTAGEQLLRRFNPILVIHPLPWGKEPLSRPGSREGHVWGDYHPCSAEFFLERVNQRDEPPGYEITGVFKDFENLPRTGIAALKEKLAAMDPELTRQWELNLAEIASQDGTRSWSTYRDWLSVSHDGFEPVTYARCVEVPAGFALQYWYLYLYNDFVNVHEGDWEMVTIELDAACTPLRIGLSSHTRGFWRNWEHAPKDGDRPVVYVARGSHAGYFRYRGQGHRVRDLG